MERQAKFPYQFFVVTFTWSWLIWLPLVLAGAGILPLGKDLLSALITPVYILAAFGPAAGAFYCLRALHGKDAVRQYLRGLVDLRFGWQAWLTSRIGVGWEHLVGVDAAGTMGGAAPGNALALRMGFPAVCFDRGFFRRRTGRTGLARVYFGPIGRATGGVAW